MAVNRTDPVLSYNFLLTLVDSSSLLAIAAAALQPATMGGFSECSGLEVSMQPEEYREGGQNSAVLKFANRLSWSNIRLKRGVVASDDLWRWIRDYADGRGKRRDGTIVLQNDQREPVRVWSFVRALPVKWAGPPLNAGQTQVAVEELE